MIGKGEYENKLRNKVRKLGLEDRVQFLINRSDVNELYQAMDIFVMPSFFEGIPVVAIEAQANGLPCIISDKISKEIILTSNIQMENIKKGAKYWAKKISEIHINRSNLSIKELKENCYDVKIESINLLDEYKKLFYSIR